ncbi:YjbF family lipoprotein [Spongiibacter sp. KMU-158]|uniref:YjbF family lipoprotein n=1 Tax=Spongiibacter pelagi TaxID=2760804 RepID=A0A927GVF9_9GAMM|nr:YjbF family lipoprotein [Spongiibacter pelagi]MBD2857837.1 YjbF family lipoprotein [Spongiibacter pelagi]
MRWLFVILLLTLEGCAQNSNDLLATFEEAFIDSQDTLITKDQVIAIPFSSIKSQYGEGGEALLVLGLAERSHYSKSPTLKWVSAGKEMINTLSGRVVKTVGIYFGNLLSLSSEKPDPLSLGLQLDSTPKEWRYYLSWEPGYHRHYQAHSRFSSLGLEQVNLLWGAETLLVIVEQVEIPQLNVSYQNRYWLDPATGKVKLSEQYPYPGAPRIRLEVARPFGGV